MIIIELDDIRAIHSANPLNPDGPTEYRFTPGERPLWLDEPDMFETDKRFHPGPYLLRLTEDAAWLSRNGETWELAVQRARYPCLETTMWHGYATLYADAIGITMKALTTRFYWMWRYMQKRPNKWLTWSKVYHWPEGSNEVWDGFHHHEQYETRDFAGRREVRYVR